MNNESNIKMKIAKYLQNEAVSQEFLIKQKIEKLQFSKEEIVDLLTDTKLIESNSINKLILEFSKIKCNFIARHFYETSFEDKRKLRELDLIAYFNIVDNDDMLYMITFLGDIKKTDDYKWVFTTDITADEVDYENFDFPKITFNEESNFFSLILGNIISLYRDSKIPIATDNITFQPNGEIVARKKRNKSRDFFEQVNSGIERYYWDRLDHEPDSYKYRKVYHILIPILLTSSNYYYCNQLPPNSSEDLVETDMLIYLFSPSKPSILDRWRTPILLVSENNLVSSLKKIISYYKLISWKYQNN